MIERLADCQSAIQPTASRRYRARAQPMSRGMLVRSVRRDIFCMVLWHALQGAGCFLAPFRGWSLRSPPGYWLGNPPGWRGLPEPKAMAVWPS